MPSGCRVSPAASPGSISHSTSDVDTSRRHAQHGASACSSIQARSALAMAGCRHCSRSDDPSPSSSAIPSALSCSCCGYGSPGGSRIFSGRLWALNSTSTWSRTSAGNCSSAGGDAIGDHLAEQRVRVPALDEVQLKWLGDFFQRLIDIFAVALQAVARVVRRQHHGDHLAHAIGHICGTTSPMYGCQCFMPINPVAAGRSASSRAWSPSATPCDRSSSGVRPPTSR